MADVLKGDAMNGIIKAICIAEVAGAPMREVQMVEAVAGVGLAGDRYAKAEGSFNRGRLGKNQVTLMNTIFFEGTEFAFTDSRRNLFVEGTELMWLIGRDFQIGTARFRGVKYCDPCQRPSKLSGKTRSFKEAFLDRGGLRADVLESGTIRVGDVLIPPPKGY